MKRYKVKVPRMAIAIAAFAMAVFTFGLVVALPAMTSPDEDERLAAVITTSTPTEVAVSSYPSK
jgi:hypothetical protein